MWCKTEQEEGAARSVVGSPTVSPGISRILLRRDPLFGGGDKWSHAVSLDGDRIRLMMAPPLPGF